MEGMPRKPPSQIIFELARKYDLKTLAQAIGVDTESAVSKKLSGEQGFTLPQLDSLFDLVGLSLSDQSDHRVFIDRDELDALNVLAGKYMKYRTGGKE